MPNCLRSKCNIPHKIVLLTIIFVFLHVGSVVAQCIEGNCRDGTGTLSLPDGRKYSGKFEGSRMTGFGVMEFLGVICEGNFHCGVPYGYLKFKYPDGKIYLGEYSDGKRNGNGMLSYPDGTRYEGEFKDGKFNGKGTLCFQDGTRYVGNFKDNRFNGHGKVFLSDGSVYAAQFKKGRTKGNVTSPVNDRTGGFREENEGGKVKLKNFVLESTLNSEKEG